MRYMAYSQVCYCNQNQQYDRIVESTQFNCDWKLCKSIASIIITIMIEGLWKCYHYYYNNNNNHGKDKKQIKFAKYLERCGQK